MLLHQLVVVLYDVRHRSVSEQPQVQFWQRAWRGSLGITIFGKEIAGDSCWLHSNDLQRCVSGIWWRSPCHCTTMSHVLPCCLDTPGRVNRKHDYRRGLISTPGVRLRHFQSTCCSRDRLEMLYMPLGLSTLKRTHTISRPTST